MLYRDIQVPPSSKGGQFVKFSCQSCRGGKGTVQYRLWWYQQQRRRVTSDLFPFLSLLARGQLGDFVFIGSRGRRRRRGDFLSLFPPLPSSCCAMIYCPCKWLKSPPPRPPSLSLSSFFPPQKCSGFLWGAKKRKLFFFFVCRLQMLPRSGF